MKILDESYDNVIKSHFFVARSNYDFALKKLVPLMDRLDMQRKVQATNFYRRLERDLFRGCLMPPLTIAFISSNCSAFDQADKAKSLVENNISDAFVLDGIQRLNTLHRASLSKSNSLDLNTPLYLNVLVCDSMDSLLYRMITLNNGQKPMTARHQIEILTKNIYRFDGNGVDVQTEKEKSKKLIVGSFDHASFVKAYLAFLSKSTNIDNRKLIEEKLDELIAGKILDSDITQHDVEFADVVSLIGMLSSEDSGDVKDWFRNENNLIGFSVGIIDGYRYIKNLSGRDFRLLTELFDEAFSNFDFSRIKVGQERRKLVAEFISSIARYANLEPLDLMGELLEK